MSHNRAPIGRNQDDCAVLDGHHWPHLLLACRAAEPPL